MHVPYCRQRHINIWKRKGAAFPAVNDPAADATTTTTTTSKDPTSMEYQQDVTIEKRQSSSLSSTSSSSSSSPSFLSSSSSPSFLSSSSSSSSSSRLATSIEEHQDDDDYDNDEKISDDDPDLIKFNRAVDDFNVGDYDSAMDSLNNLIHPEYIKKAEVIMGKIQERQKMENFENPGEPNLDNRYNNSNNNNNNINNNHKNAFRNNQETRHRHPHKTYITNDTATNDYTKDQLQLVQKINACNNYYEMFGVASSATIDEIKKSYKRLALQLHPDKNYAPGAIEAFKKLSNAVTILTADDKRYAYDVGDYSNDSTSSDIPSRNNNNNNTGNMDFNYQDYEAFESAFMYDDFNTEELLHLFFGTQPPRYRGRTYRPANQRQPHYESTAIHPIVPTLLILVLVIGFVAKLGFFTPVPVYQLYPDDAFNVKRDTKHLGVPYYVKETFNNDFTGSVGVLESSIEEEYIFIMKDNCFAERNLREAKMARARRYGNKLEYAEAQDTRMPSCDRLKEIGIKRYSL